MNTQVDLHAQSPNLGRLQWKIFTFDESMASSCSSHVHVVLPTNDAAANWSGPKEKEALGSKEATNLAPTSTHKNALLRISQAFSKILFRILE